MGKIVKLLKPVSIYIDANMPRISDKRYHYVKNDTAVAVHQRQGNLTVLQDIDHKEGMDDLVFKGYLDESKGDLELAIAAFKTVGQKPEGDEAEGDDKKLTPAQKAAATKAAKAAEEAAKKLPKKLQKKTTNKIN